MAVCGRAVRDGDTEDMRVKISERSWHLRYVRWWDGVGNRASDLIYRDPDQPPKPYTPTNLCGYFWMVTLIGPGMFFWLLTFFPAVFVLKYVGLLVFWGVMALIRGVRSLFHAVRPSKAETSNEPNLFVEYVKAKKRRICPLIEVVP